jgi:catalase (peroxidase I)
VLFLEALQLFRDTATELIVLAGCATVELAVNVEVAASSSAGRTDATQEDTEVHSFDENMALF